MLLKTSNILTKYLFSQTKNLFCLCKAKTSPLPLFRETSLWTNMMFIQSHIYKCMTLERSSHISNSEPRDVSYSYISYNYIFVLTHSVWGTELSLHLITSQMLIGLIEEQCVVQFHRSGAQVPFQPGIFFIWASLHNCASYSFPCVCLSNLMQITTFFNQACS